MRSEYLQSFCAYRNYYARYNYCDIYFSDEGGEEIMDFAYISIILNGIKFLLEMAASILIIMCAVKYLRKQ